MRNRILFSLAAIVLASTLSACNLGVENVAEPSTGIEETPQAPIVTPEAEPTEQEVIVTDPTGATEAPVVHDPTEAPAPLG